MCKKQIALAFLMLCAASKSAVSLTADELKQISAAMINLKGFLCAEVTDIRPVTLPGTFEVTCIEYRGGYGKVRYMFQPSRNIVEKAG